MHLLLVGPGALGCLLSYFIQKGCATTGDRFTLLDYNADRAKILAERGIQYHKGSESITFKVTATPVLESLAEVDVILLCVKSYDVQASLDYCRPLLHKKSLLVFLQNGISHIDMQNYCGDAATAFGTTTEGATLLSPGQVRHAGSGVTYLGFLSPPTPTASRLLDQTAAILAAGGLEVKQTTSILTRLWAKLFVNVGINALTASLKCRNGELLALPGVEQRMRAAVHEAERVAVAKDISIEQDPFAATCTVCEKTAHNISSMLQDVQNNKRTEIDAINVAISSYGRKLDIPTPENDRLCSEINRIEKSYGAR